MNTYQAGALLLGLNLFAGTGVIVWNRFRSQKKDGVGKIFFQIQIFVLTLMAVVDDFFRFLWLALLTISVLGWGVHLTIQHKKPYYQAVKGLGFGRQMILSAGIVCLWGSIWMLASALLHHEPNWVWEILHGRVMK